MPVDGVSQSSPMQIAISGILAQHKRMETNASNLANANTTNSGGEVYKRKDVNFTEQSEGLTGVRAEVVEDDSAARLAYDPDHPQAQADGFVEMPNVDVTQEIVNTLETANAYDANVAAFRKADEMNETILDLFA